MIPPSAGITEPLCGIDRGRAAPPRVPPPDSDRVGGVPRSVVVWLALGIASSCIPLKPEAAEVKPIARLPVVTGKDLNGKAWEAPANLPGSRTLVILGYEEEQQQEIDTWTAGLGLTQRENKLPWVEMPVIDEPGIIMRWIIDTGMQRGIPDREIRGHVWTVYTERKAFLAACGIDAVNTIHVLVVSRDGTILARETGRYTEEAANRIRAVVEGENPSPRDTRP